MVSKTTKATTKTTNHKERKTVKTSKSQSSRRKQPRTIEAKLRCHFVGNHNYVHNVKYGWSHMREAYLPLRKFLHGGIIHMAPKDYWVLKMRAQKLIYSSHRKDWWDRVRRSLQPGINICSKCYQGLIQELSESSQPEQEQLESTEHVAVENQSSCSSKTTEAKENKENTTTNNNNDHTISNQQQQEHPNSKAKDAVVVQGLDVVAHVESAKLDITINDLQRTKQGEMLNDNLVDLGITMINDKFSEQKSKFFIFNSQFFPILNKDFDRCVKRVNKTVQVMSHEMVCIPICIDYHWVVIMIQNMNHLMSTEIPTRMLYCNSFTFSLRQNPLMGENESGEDDNEGIDFDLMLLVLNYIVERYNFEKGTSVTVDSLNEDMLHIHSVQLPQQTNEFDCGLYCLQNIEELLSQHFTNKEQMIQLDQQGLYNRKAIEARRVEIRNHILHLCQQQNRMSQELIQHFTLALQTPRSNTNVAQSADDRSQQHHSKKNRRKKRKAPSSEKRKSSKR